MPTPAGGLPGDAAESAEVFGAPAPAQAEAAQHGWRVFAILALLMGFASVSTDLYLPAMPTMAHELKAKRGLVEWTISGYLVGFSLGQLLWGPIGDRLGRRIPVAIGLLLFIAGSAGCALAQNVEAMIGWRVLQAAGACASVVLGRAMVRDLFEGDRAAQMMSSLMTVMMIAPLMGPVLGGQILILAGWRAIFWVLVGVGALTLLLLATLPETLAPHRRNTEPFSRSLQLYAQLLKHRSLLGYGAAGGFFYAGLFAYIAGTPFAYIDYHHLPAQHYGLVFAIGILGITATHFANARLVGRLGSLFLLQRGAQVAACAGIAVAIAAKTGWGGLPGLVVCLFFFTAMTGFIVANSIAGALTYFPRHSGAVSALVGAMQYGSGILGSALVGALNDGTPFAMGAIIGIAGIGCAFCAGRVRISPEEMSARD